MFSELIVRSLFPSFEKPKARISLPFRQLIFLRAGYCERLNGIVPYKIASDMRLNVNLRCADRSQGLFAFEMSIRGWKPCVDLWFRSVLCVLFGYNHGYKSSIDYF